MVDHVHRYEDIKHTVRGLGGEVEELVQRRCACGAIEGPKDNGAGPALGEWV